MSFTEWHIAMISATSDDVATRFKPHIALLQVNRFDVRYGIQWPFGRAEYAVRYRTRVIRGHHLNSRTKLRLPVTDKRTKVS